MGGSGCVNPSSNSEQINLAFILIYCMVHDLCVTCSCKCWLCHAFSAWVRSTSTAASCLTAYSGDCIGSGSGIRSTVMNSWGTLLHSWYTPSKLTLLKKLSVSARRVSRWGTGSKALGLRVRHPATSVHAENTNKFYQRRWLESSWIRLFII